MNRGNAGRRRILSSWPAWTLVIVAAFLLVVVGGSRDRGPLSQQERIEQIGRRIACPTCAGESISVSRATAALSIRSEIARQVIDGQRSDDEIVGYIVSRFGGEVLLVPRASGVDALVWALPVAVAVLLVAGLAFAFVRWRRQPGAPGAAPRVPRWVTVSVVGAVVVVASASGWWVARESGQRLPGQTLSGGIADSTATLLSQARALGAGDVTGAIELYGRVLEIDPDNVEAITYRAWLVSLSARNFERALRMQAYRAAVAAFGRAIELDPTYADAVCFLGIIVYRDGDDAPSALEFLDRCLASAPPAEVRTLVTSLRDEVAAAVGE